MGKKEKVELQVEERHYECGWCGERKSLPVGTAPGQCYCGTRHRYPWKLSFTPWPEREPGYVIVMRGDGVAQELKGPHFQEDKSKWEPAGQVIDRVARRQK
jgi:hypothetical protein